MTRNIKVRINVSFQMSVLKCSLSNLDGLRQHRLDQPPVPQLRPGNNKHRQQS